MIVVLGSDGLISLSERTQRRASLRVQCSVVREDPFELIAASGRDLSLDGLLAECRKRVRVGEPLLVSFRIPNSDVWVDAEAEVARVIRGFRPGDVGYGAGLRFLSLDGMSKAVLAAHLRRIPPPIPTRRPRIDYARSLLAVA